MIQYRSMKNIVKKKLKYELSNLCNEAGDVAFFPKRKKLKGYQKCRKKR